MSEIDKGDPFKEAIIKKAVDRGYKVFSLEEVGEGAFAGVLANDECVGPFAYIPGECENTKLIPSVEWWDYFPTHSPDELSLYAYHSCIIIKPENFKAEETTDVLAMAKEFIDEIGKFRLDRFSC